MNNYELEIQTALLNIKSQLERALKVKHENIAAYAFEAGHFIGYARAMNDCDNQELENYLHLAKGELFYAMLPNNTEGGTRWRIDGALSYINDAIEVTR